MFIVPIKSRLQILEERKSPEFSIKTDYMILMYIPTPQKNIDYNTRVTDFVRLLAVVSKKISKKAVVRNHIRRKIKEAFKRVNKTLLKNQYDYQIIARHAIVDVSIDLIVNDIEKCLKIKQNTCNNNCKLY